MWNFPHFLFFDGLTVSLTLLLWNILIAVAILCSLGQELDPVLDLSHPGVNAMAGALTPIANYSRLGESKYNNLWYLSIYIYIIYGYSLFTVYLPFSVTISGPPESPWHESLALLLSLAQMWKLNIITC